MKKFLFLFVLCLLTVLCAQLSPPVLALSFSDIFPPIQLKDSSRQPPRQVIAPELVGDNNAFSNTLDDSIKHRKMIKLSNVWLPKVGAVGATDANGHKQEEYVAQDARDLKDVMNLQELSNNGMRNFQSFFSKGEISCNVENIEKSFKDMAQTGSGAFVRMNSQTSLNVERSQFLIDAAESLREKNPLDIATQDIAVAWDCGNNTCTELSQGSDKCRPITVSEILYGLRAQPLYYQSADSIPTLFDSGLLANVEGYYLNNGGQYGQYKKRYPQKYTFHELPLEIYLMMYSQLGAPKGNIDNEIKITNMDNGKPVPTIFHNNLPGGVAIAAPQAKTVNFISSVSTTNLPKSTSDDYYNSYSVGTKAIDSTPIASIGLFFLQFFKHLAPGEQYQHSESIEMINKNDKGLIENTSTIEKNLIQLIPAADSIKEDYLNKTITSVTAQNEKYGIVHPLYRGNEIYANSFVNFLHPVTWQNK